jgi:glutamyl-Q tRNA(Asp) synthetase
LSPCEGGFVTRFAPSPTGPLHLGHALSVLTAYDAAQAAGGRFILRIEDIDRTRCRPAFEQVIYDDLAWLGIDWEPSVRRQSEHMPDYEAALEQLRSQGLLYRCFRTRKEVAQAAAAAPHGPQTPVLSAPLSSDEEARRLARGDAFAWRLSLRAARARLGDAYDYLAFTDLDAGALFARPDAAGDVVLARKDVGVAYHLACGGAPPLPDGAQVIRGEDRRDAAHSQRLLQALLSLPTPVYHHHRLMLDVDGKRFAKRDGTGSLSELRARGVTPAEVRTRVGLG